MNNLYRIPALKMIRLMRRGGASPKGVRWKAGVWAIDTPSSRASLLALVDLGNMAYGSGTHWLEEHDSEYSCPYPADIAGSILTTAAS